MRCPLEGLPAECRRVVAVERSLERGSGDVPVEDARVGVVEDRRLHPPLEQGRRLAHEVLVERVLGGDEDREAVAAAAGASPLLAEARDGAGETDRDRAVEIADVDAQLERVGRRDAEQVALDETPLDLAPLLRRVARPVRREPLGGLRIEPVNCEAVDELGGLAALGEADRSQAAAGEPCEQSRRLAERARPQPELRVEERRVPERHRPLGARRCVVLHDRRVLARECMRELAGVRDGRRGEEELRLGAVDPREPAQPPQDVRDVRAEDAAVDVRLVDDDESEVVEEVAPQVVPRQDADVEHVGVREHEVRPAADLAPPLGGRVAVVDRRADRGDAERAERARLVLRERLRRVEVEGACVPVGGERVEDRQVEGKRLARCGARGDDDVAAAPRRAVRLGLMRVELVDAAARERFPHSRLERGGQRRRPRLARGLGCEVGELVPREQVVPGGGGGAHRRHLDASANEYSRSAGSSMRSSRRPASRKVCRKRPSGRWLAPTLIRTPEPRQMPGASS